MVNTRLRQLTSMLATKAKVVLMIPAVRQRVTVQNQKGVFLVVWVDPEREICSLVQLSNQGYLIEDVPFASLQPVEESGNRSA